MDAGDFSGTPGTKLGVPQGWTSKGGVESYTPSRFMLQKSRKCMARMRLKHFSYLN